MAHVSLEAAYPSEDVQLQLHSGSEFFRELGNDIGAAGAAARITITTMDFDTGDPLVKSVMDELYEAGERGAHVTFGIDAFALLNARRTFGTLVLPFRIRPEMHQRRVAPLERLGEIATAQYGITNISEGPTLNFFKGRSHIKLAIVNDKVYLGGPSFQGSDRLDVVASFEDAKTADLLHDLASEIVTTASTSEALGIEDQKIAVNDDTTLLIDAGVPGQSIILEEVLRIIDEAEEQLTISSPFLLTGITSRHLKQAFERGVDVYIARNHVSKYEQLRPVHRLLLAREKLRLPAEFFMHQVPRQLPALHAKVLASEAEGLVTSHNFIETGVNFGTAEIGLLSQNRHFAKAVRRMLLSQVMVVSEGTVRKSENTPIRAAMF